MRICLLGEFSSKTDEGMKNISSNYLQQLSKFHEVMALNQRKVIVPQNISKLMRFRPDIIHYIHGPTIRSLVLTKLISLFTGRAKVVVSATRPFFSRFSRRFIPFFKPDHVFVQSNRWKSFFDSYSCRNSFLPNGLSLSNFKKLTDNEVEDLKKKYGIDNNKFIVLHVGHIKKNRNLEIMASLQKKHSNIQCLIIGSNSTDPDKDLELYLSNCGCLILRDYFENISEIYNLADCYLFTVKDNPPQVLPSSYNEIGCIEMPMSVLEAMACNIPVVTTRYGALSYFFEEGDGFWFADTEDEILSTFEHIEKMGTPKSRAKVSKLDWFIIVKKIEKEFLVILDNYR